MSVPSKFLKAGKIFLWVLGCFVGLLLIVGVAAEIVLSPKLCTSLVKKYAPQFIDGELKMASVSASVFSHFPAISLEIDSLAVVYPAERFDTSECKGVDNLLVKSGTYGFRPFARNTAPQCDSSVVQMDTLATFAKLSVSVNVLPLLKGMVNVKNVSLSHPRVFIHRYADGNTNLNVIKLKLEDDEEKVEDEDTSASVISGIVLRKLFLGDGAAVVYTDQADTVMATVSIRNMDFKGRLSTESINSARFRFSLDTMFVAGDLKKDTLLFALDHLHINAGHGDMDVDADATAYAATHAFGRVKIPIGMTGGVKFDTESPSGAYVGLRNFGIDVATIHADTDMDAVFGDTLALKGKFSIPSLDVRTLLSDYAVNFMPLAAKIGTDARLSLALDIDGWYDSRSGALPAFNASLDLPKCYVSHEDVELIPRMELHAVASAGQGRPINAEIKTLTLTSEGIGAQVNGSVEDVLGGDPLLDVNASLRASMDTLNRFLAKTVEMNASGSLNFDAKGKFRLSNLDVYNVKGADMDANLKLSNVKLKSFDDSLDVFCNNLGVRMGLMEHKAGKSGRKVKTLGASVDIDSLHLEQRGLAQIAGRKLHALLLSSPDPVKVNDSTSYNPLFATLNLGSVFLEGQDSLSLRLKDSRNSFTLHPSRSNLNVPVLNLTSNNARLRAKSGPHRVMLSGLDFTARGEMNGDEHRKRVKAYVDSVYNAHPTWTRDSVMRYLNGKAMKSGELRWAGRNDFKEQDIKLDLGESFRKYFTQWSINGSLKLKRAFLATPAFPLRTSVHNFKGTFDNDRVSLDSLRIKSGTSNLTANGAVTNLRRALLRRGKIRLDAGIGTDSLDISELLYAYALGNRNMEAGVSQSPDNADDDDLYMAQVARDSITDMDSISKLLVVPGNLDASLKIRGKGVTYSSLDITSLKADMFIKDRCLQITGTEARTTVGDLGLEAFYATKSKKSLLTGFDLNLKGIDAGDVIELLPQIDTAMPLLKSFDGKLNCNITATAQLDTNSNILLPTVNGVLRITGKDLHFHDNPQITKVAKLLWFKNPQRATIDTMTVEGVIKDNTCEIFPFILKMDRWSIAFAGVQSLNKPFHYHVSLAKTPFLIKLGANIYGEDFDHMKFKLGKAKYRNLDLPSFSGVIDTTRINLSKSIQRIFDRGVERAVRDHKNMDAIVRQRERMKYNHSVALDTLETLKGKDAALLDSLNRSETVDSTAVVQQPDVQKGGNR